MVSLLLAGVERAVSGFDERAQFASERSPATPMVVESQEAR